MTTTVDLAGLEEAIENVVQKLAELKTENAKLKKQLTAKRKGGSPKSDSQAVETVAEVRERLQRLESDLEGLLAS